MFCMLGLFRDGTGSRQESMGHEKSKVHRDPAQHGLDNTYSHRLMPNFLYIIDKFHVVYIILSMH